MLTLTQYTLVYLPSCRTGSGTACSSSTAATSTTSSSSSASDVPRDARDARGGSISGSIISSFLERDS